TVLSGVIRLTLGTRTIMVTPGQAVEFYTMTPHLLEAHLGPAEILTIFDHEGEKAHLHPRNNNQDYLWLRSSGLPTTVGDFVHLALLVICDPRSSRLASPKLSGAF